jgi:hypothetical protein
MSQRFDVLSRVMAKTLSRRRFLLKMSAGLLAGVAGLVGSRSNANAFPGLSGFVINGTGSYQPGFTAPVKHVPKATFKPALTHRFQLNVTDILPPS